MKRALFLDRDGVINAQKEFDLDLPASVLIGDKASDIAAGKTAGIGTNILYSNSRHRPRRGNADWIARSLLEVAAWFKDTGQSAWKQ